MANWIFFVISTFVILQNEIGTGVELRSFRLGLALMQIQTLVDGPCMLQSCFVQESPEIKAPK